MTAAFAAILIIGFIYEKYNKKIKSNNNAKIAFIVLCIRFSVVIAVCLIVKKSYPEIFNIWDGPHYIDIAKNGYVKSGAGKEFIVFYPLYPLLIRIFAVIFGNYEVSALIISNICAAVGGLYFYKLCEIDMEEDDCIFSLLLMCTFPFSFFMSGVYTESLFVLLTSMTFYYTLKKRYIFASAAAFLAALTRIQGILLAVFMFAEILKSEKRKCVFALSPVSGFGVYLLINKIIFGNAFEFMKYQKEIWYQEPSWLGDNIEKFCGYILNGSELTYQIMLPQIFLFVIGCILIYTAMKKGMRTSFAVYGISYIFTVYSASWLLSGGRYFSSLIILYQAAAITVKNKSARHGLIILNALLMIVYVVLYAEYKQIM